MTAPNRVSADAIKDRVPLADTIGQYVALSKKGNEYSGWCPFHKEKTPSFTVNQEKGFYHCFGCGAHGDVFDFIQAIKGVDFNEARKILLQTSGLANEEDIAAAEKRHKEREAARQKEQEADEAARSRLACEHWKHGRKDVAGSLVETYLTGRGLVFTDARPIPPSLRWSTLEKYIDPGDPQDGTLWPVMIGAIQRYDKISDSSPVVAIHRTYLQKDGSGKAPVSSKKKMLGPYRGGAIRFAPAAERVAIAEGIETALSVAQVSPGLAVWAAGSLNNIGGGGLGNGEAHPDRPGKRLPSTEPDPMRPGVILPPIVREVWILADNDGKDPKAQEAIIQRAAARYTSEGRRVVIKRPPEGMDFNDLLKSGEEVT